jgi:16S rRNA (uracil1498-N3)-methyltransferase
MHCFYIDPPADGLAALPAEEAKHALKVLRLKPGDEVCAMDGVARRWRGEIDRVEGTSVWVRLLEPLPDNEPPVRVTVYEGLPKADKLDLIAQKLTELGAAALAPLRMERCVVKLDKKDGAKRRERLEKIAREAAKQCRRARPLAVSEPMDWKPALEAMAKHDLLLIPWEEARDGRLSDLRAAFPDARDIGIVIGPEGGISPEEMARLSELGCEPITLGKRILRTETAGLAALSAFFSLFGEMEE